ncbi:MAG: Ig-like domain-containing protein [Cyanobacteria bacterium P01_H01_bin.152]
MTTPFGPELDLNNLENDRGFVINGAEDGDDSGRTVSGIGDIDGDGRDDFIIGAPTDGDTIGAAYVVFGRDDLDTIGSLDLASLSPGEGFVINGLDDGDNLGLAVSAAGDVNGDMIADFIVSAPNADPTDENGVIRGGAGKTYVVFGDNALKNITSLDLSTLDGTNGFVLNGVDNNDASGRAVSGIGDFNDDGVDDLIVAAPEAFADPAQVRQGESYVIFGRNDLGDDGSVEISDLVSDGDGFVIRGATRGERAGSTVSAAGDVNNDGSVDLLVAAPTASPGNIQGAGQVYVLFGDSTVGTGGLLDLANLQSDQGFVIEGLDLGDRLGSALSNLGDVNGDGIDDFILSVPSASSDTGQSSVGESYVIFGRTGLNSVDLSELSNPGNGNGFVIQGVDFSDGAGTAVSGVADINNDGFNDILIGAPLANPDINPIPGQAYVVFGSDMLTGSVLNLADLDGENGFAITGVASQDRLGDSISVAGDVNGDGIDDLIVGAPSTNNNSGFDKSYVIFGFNGANANPTPVDDAFTTDEDTALTLDVLANDSDPDNDPLTINSVTQPTNGSVTINADNTLSYIPAADFNGTDSFTYQVDDGNGGQAIATVSLTVNPVNDAPVATDDSTNTNQGTAVTVDVLANDSDVDGDGVSVSALGNAANGTVALNLDGTVTYTPNAGFSGNDSFTYELSDGDLTDTATVSVLVGDVNEAPVATDDTNAITEDSVPDVSGNVLSNDSDPDGDALTLASVAGNPIGTGPIQGQYGTLAVNADGSYTYTLDNDNPAVDALNDGETLTESFDYSVSDGALEDTAQLAITINGSTDASPTRLTIAPLDADRPEGDSGSTPFTFTVTRTGDLDKTTTVEYLTAGLDPGLTIDDFATIPNGQVTFAPNETVKTITLNIAGDQNAEADEAFQVELFNPSNAEIDIDTAPGTIRNDDPATIIRIVVDNAIFPEGRGPLYFITREGDLSQETTVDYTVRGSGTNPASAADFRDGEFPRGQITFAPGQDSVPLQFRTVDDDEIEFDETYELLLSNASNGVIVDGVSGGLIRDDDAPPPVGYRISGFFTLTDFEGDRFSVEVERLGDASNASEVTLEIVGTGQHPTDSSDFGLPSNPFVVQLAPNESSKVVEIPVVRDTLVELDETFDVNIVSVSDGLPILVPTASGTIFNDDQDLNLINPNLDLAEGNSGTTPFTFSVFRSGFLGGETTVDYTVSGTGRTQASAEDFGGSFPSGTLTFGEDEIVKTVTLDVVADTVLEGDETFTVTLANAGANTNIVNGTLSGTIRNDDAGGSTIAVTEATDDGTGQTIGTLSWAIQQANERPGIDTIELQTDVRLNFADDRIRMEPLIDSDLTIEGNGFTISGDNNNNGQVDIGDVDINGDGFINEQDADRPVFFVRSGNVTLQNLTVTGAVARGGEGNSGGAGMGGALFVYDGAVNVENVEFAENQAIGGGGQVRLLPRLDLSNLNGRNGFAINGIDSRDSSGRSVSSAGDINGDGIDDLIIGGPYADPNGARSAGESYVVFGRRQNSDASFNLSDLNGANGFVINGIDEFDDSGRSVSGAGDINGDGIDDLIIGGSFADPNGVDAAGESYVVFGRDSKLGQSFDASFNLSDLNGANGFVINGIDSDDFSGWSVSGAGDINGDGIDDLIIGASGADPNGVEDAGESYVVFGRDSKLGQGFDASLNLSELNGANGFVINGIDEFDDSGRSVSSAGDVNGDGIDDLIIGARYADPNGAGRAGESYVVFGRDSKLGQGFDASFNLSELNGANGFVINGIDEFDNSGRSVSSAGDINGDGIDDLIIGGPYAEPNGVEDAGESYVVFGRDSKLGQGFDASLNLSELNGANGFVINGIDEFDRSGWSVSGAGDINGDGIDDLIIGARFADSNTSKNDGESYVIFGSRQSFSTSFNLSELNGANGFVIGGTEINDNSGGSVSSAGDFNGDGIDDLIIGADGADPNGLRGAGESYVIFGSRSDSIEGDGPLRPVSQFGGTIGLGNERARNGEDRVSKSTGAGAGGAGGAGGFGAGGGVGGAGGDVDALNGSGSKVANGGSGASDGFGVTGGLGASGQLKRSESKSAGNGGNGGDGGFGGGGAAGSDGGSVLNATLRIRNGNEIRRPGRSGDGGDGGFGGGGGFTGFAGSGILRGGLSEPDEARFFLGANGRGGFGAGDALATSIDAPRFSGGGAGLGGAIFVRSGTLNVTNSRFTNNQAIGGAGRAAATNIDDGSGFGGAIFAITDEALQNHRGSDRGLPTDTPTVTVDGNTQFNGNTSQAADGNTIEDDIFGNLSTATADGPTVTNAPESLTQSAQAGTSNSDPIDLPNDGILYQQVQVDDIIGASLTDEQQTLLKTGFSLPASLDLNTFDPLTAAANSNATGVDVLAQLIAAQTLVVQASAALQGVLPNQPEAALQTVTANALLAFIENQVGNGQTVNFGDAAQLQTLLNNIVNDLQALAPTLDLQAVIDGLPQLVEVIGASTQEILDTTNLGDLNAAVVRLIQIQTLAQGEIATDLEAAISGQRPLAEVVAENTGTALEDQITAIDDNVAPLAQADEFTTDRTTPLIGNLFADNGNGADSDFNGDTLSITAINGEETAVGQTVTLESGASLLVNADGRFTYTPADLTDPPILDPIQADDLFTYTVSDGNGGTDIAEAIVNLTNAPTPLPDLEIGLYDADTDTLISTLSDGDEILASTVLGRDVTFVAMVPEESPFFGQVESMFFDLNQGTITQTENFEPYALFGDKRGDLRGGSLPLSESNSLTIDLFSENKRRGDLLGTVTRDFTLVDDVTGQIDLEIGLYDADTDTLITTLEDGGEILASDIIGRDINVVATVPDDSFLAGRVESLFFDFNQGAITQTENFEPYALFGDRNGDLRGGSLPLNETNNLSIDLFSEDKRRGDLLGTVTRDFTVVDDVTGQIDLEIGLYDADTDTLITPLEDGDEILASDIAGRDLTVVATVPDDSFLFGRIESLFFDFNQGAITQTENFEPYALFGDRNGDLRGGSLPLNETNNLSIDLFSEDKRRGDLLGTVTRNFTIVDTLG